MSEQDAGVDCLRITSTAWPGGGGVCAHEGASPRPLSASLVARLDIPRPAHTYRGARPVSINSHLTPMYVHNAQRAYMQLEIQLAKSL